MIEPAFAGFFYGKILYGPLHPAYLWSQKSFEIIFLRLSPNHSIA